MSVSCFVADRCGNAGHRPLPAAAVDACEIFCRSDPARAGRRRRRERTPPWAQASACPTAPWSLAVRHHGPSKSCCSVEGKAMGQAQAAAWPRPVHTVLPEILQLLSSAAHAT